MKLKLRRRYGQVAPRPQMRRQRLRKIFAMFSVFVLGVCALAALAHFRGPLRMLRQAAFARLSRQENSQKLPTTIVACVTKGKKLMGCLDAEGHLFQVPDSRYPEDVPTVEMGNTDSSGLVNVAKFIKSLSGSADYFSPLVHLAYISPQDGWKADFADGTRAEWGDFRWTNLKLERMRQVMDDAKADMNGPADLDLRYFADGRIILRTTSAKAVSMR